MSKEKREMTSFDIVQKLANWSKKYPRGRVYSFHQQKMDEELIEIEEEAKKFIDSLKDF